MDAHQIWKITPAPRKSEIVRQFDEILREYKEPLGTLVSYEMGKSYQVGLLQFIIVIVHIYDFIICAPVKRRFLIHSRNYSYLFESLFFKKHDHETILHQEGAYTNGI